MIDRDKDFKGAAYSAVYIPALQRFYLQVEEGGRKAIVMHNRKPVECPLFNQLTRSTNER